MKFHKVLNNFLIVNNSMGLSMMDFFNKICIFWKINFQNCSFFFFSKDYIFNIADTVNN